MNKLLNVFTLAAMSLVSCNNDIINESTAKLLKNSTEISLEEIENEKGIYEFIYNGHSYSSNYEIINDSMIIEDPNVQKVVKEINTYKNVITYVHPDKKVEYIVNFNEKRFLENCEVLDINKDMVSPYAIAPGYPPITPYVNFYEDSKLKGFRLNFSGLFNKYFAFKNDPLGMKLEGKLSSLDYSWGSSNYGAYVYVILYYQPDMPSDAHWERPNPNAYAIIFAADQAEPYHYIHYLKSYKLYPGASKNWNDRANFAYFTSSTTLPPGSIM